MTGRKSQLDKFNARMGKAQKDTKVVREAEMKNSTLEKVAEREMSKQYGMKPEDIFAVFGREHIGAFVQQWNNSIETKIKKSYEPLEKEVKSLREEVKMFREENRLLREEIQNIPDMLTEFMMNAMKGMMTGVAQSFEGNYPIDYEVQEQDIQEEPSEMQKASEELVPSELMELPVLDLPRKNSKTDALGKVLWKSIMEEGKIKDTLFMMMDVAEQHGYVLESAASFKSIGSDYNGAYQAYIKYVSMQGLPGKDAWKNLVAEYRAVLSK